MGPSHPAKTPYLVWPFCCKRLRVVCPTKNSKDAPPSPVPLFRFCGPGHGSLRSLSRDSNG